MPNDIIRVERGEGAFDVLGVLPDRALRLLRDAVDDIADKIEMQAIENVPVETGALKADPFTRRDYKRRVKAAGGLAVKTEFTIGKRGKQRWVHEGTGIYGPRATPIVPRRAPFMVYTAYGKRWHLRSVLGQKPQPYLADAFDEVERRYIPFRLAELRAQLEALT